MSRLPEPPPGEQYKLKDLIIGGNYVQFERYHYDGHDAQLWYSVRMDDMDWHRPGDKLFEFPVAVNDPKDPTGPVTFLATDKAILFMRYIRKHLKLLKDAREAQRG